MTETFKKYICSNCKGKCEKGIIIEEENGMKTLKCADYNRAEKQEGYKAPQWRTATQHRPLIKGFRQEY